MTCDCGVIRHRQPDSIEIVYCLLHAAAPELLEALRQLVLPLREWLGQNPGDMVIMPDMTTTALRLGLHAYDKATGETP